MGEGGWGRIRVGLALALLVAASLSACVRMSPEEKLFQRSKQTRVCVENTTLTGMRVEIYGYRSGFRLGAVDVPEGKTECEWISVHPGRRVDAWIVTTGAVDDVLPPAWTSMVLDSPYMELVAKHGTRDDPFSFSSRRW